MTLRVAHVTLGLDVGGQEKLLVEFARHADRARHELTFVSLSGRGKLASTLEDLGATVLALEEPPGLRPGMIWRLAKLFRARGFDVMHTHDEKPLLYGAPAARLARVPVLVHTHHHGPLPSVKRRHTMLVALAARLTDCFVCVSDDSRHWLVQRGVPAAKTVTLHNGIDLERFSYTGPCLDGPVVTVARLSPEKDHATLLRAVAQARQENADIRLEIAGDGPCRSALETLASALGLNDAVRFLGEIHDVPALLARARLFALSSLTEGISLTLLEAMARGLPVVATDVGGNPEVVVEGETGVLVAAQQPEALASALLRLWNDTPRLAQFGRAARRRAEACFDVRRMVADYEATYLQRSRLASRECERPECGGPPVAHAPGSPSESAYALGPP